MYCDGYGDHRDLHVLTHSFPTRRSADLTGHADGAALVVPFARLRGRPDLLRPFERDDQYVLAVDADGDIVHAEDRHALAAGAAEVAAAGVENGVAGDPIVGGVLFGAGGERVPAAKVDRKGTRLNSSH